MAIIRLTLGRVLHTVTSLPSVPIREGIQVGDLVFDQSTGLLYTLDINHNLEQIAGSGSSSPGGPTNSTQYSTGLVLGGVSNATATEKYLRQVSSAIPSFEQVTEGGILLSDVTTNNVSTAKHGFAPKSPNDAAKYLDGTGAYSVPPGTGSGSVTSVALTVPTQEFTVVGSPVTTSGTLAVSRKTVASSSISGSVTLDFNNGVSQKFTLTGNVTFTFSNPVNGELYNLILLQDGTGGRTITWPGTVKFSGGAFPLTVTANKADSLTLLYDGTSYWQMSGAFTL